MSMFDGRGQWYRWDKKDLVTDKLALRAHHVASSIEPDRASFVTWAWRNGDGEQTAAIDFYVLPGLGLRLSYTVNGQAVTPYLVKWETTTPHYGGLRYWWLCPHCGQRVAILYGPPFWCRRCNNLTYPTTQSGGDPRQTIDNRMLRIRRRLGAAGWITDPLPEKPPGMHWATYDRLCQEYDDLAELREFSFIAGLADETMRAAGLPFTRAELAEHVRRGMAEAGRDPGSLARRLDLSGLDEAPQPARPERYTLGELAELAGLPYVFAQEAAREGLIRPDAGRTTRRKRYRRRLAGWLGKLYALRSAGMAWADIRAWAARRWLPGCENERRWPAGYSPAPDLPPARQPHAVQETPCT